MFKRVFKQLKILFIIRSPEHFSRYESIIISSLRRGHNIITLFDKECSKEKDIAKLEEFKNRSKTFNYHWLINRNDSWQIILFILRSLLTYRRFLTIKDQSSFFRERWRTYMPFWLRIPVSIPGIAVFIKTNLIGSFLKKIETKIPADKKIVNQLKEYKPDIVISPLGGVRVLSPNIEYISAAKVLNIPTASPTISWDSLTTKSLITVFPNIFLLWNNFHEKQILEHHGVTKDRVRIIGASVFDKWFGKLNPNKRNDFCFQYNLNPDNHIILYLGSAKGTAKDERWIVERLRSALDDSKNEKLKNAQIVVRPHPANPIFLQQLNIKGVWVFPKSGALPDSKETLQQSYDMYYHSIATVGIFTSAMMEALIIGKPLTVLIEPKYKKTQTDTEHFQDFIKSRAVVQSNNFDECIKFFESTLKNNFLDPEIKKEFILEYVRPKGIEISAGENSIREIEKLL